MILSITNNCIAVKYIYSINDIIKNSDYVVKAVVTSGSKHENIYIYNINVVKNFKENVRSFIGDVVLVSSYSLKIGVKYLMFLNTPLKSEIDILKDKYKVDTFLTDSNFINLNFEYLPNQLNQNKNDVLDLTDSISALVSLPIKSQKIIVNKCHKNLKECKKIIVGISVKEEDFFKYLKTLK
jgi:hypothetical protein